MAQRVCARVEYWRHARDKQCGHDSEGPNPETVEVPAQPETPGIGVGVLGLWGEVRVRGRVNTTFFSDFV